MYVTGLCADVNPPISESAELIQWALYINHYSETWSQSNDYRKASSSLVPSGGS
jgi:hypothetical protein